MRRAPLHRLRAVARRPRRAAGRAEAPARVTATGAPWLSHRAGRLIGALVAVVLGSLGTVAPALDVPYLAGRVNDLARVLSPAARDRLEAKLRDLEQRTGAQVAVLVIPSLEGESLEAYSVRVAQTWKLGRKGVDDGVLFLVAKNDRKMRIEVGYGLEPRLTDALSRQILDDQVRPRFRNNDFDGGIEAGVDAIGAVIEG
ncbi:MAG: methanol dehydrogenase, partial [Candidatus Rokuibacteriota bacterium]